MAVAILGRRDVNPDEIVYKTALAENVTVAESDALLTLDNQRAAFDACFEAFSAGGDYELPEGVLRAREEEAALYLVVEERPGVTVSIGRGAVSYTHLSPLVLEPILRMKRDMLHASPTRMSVTEMLLAMSICAATNPTVELAMSKLPELAGCEAHATVMLIDSDETALRKLGLHLTCDPEYCANEFYTE